MVIGYNFFIYLVFTFCQKKTELNDENKKYLRTNLKQKKLTITYN